MVAGVVSAILIMVSAAWEVFFVALFMDFMVWGMELAVGRMELAVGRMDFSVKGKEYFRECVGFMLGNLYICGRIV